MTTFRCRDSRGRFARCGGHKGQFGQSTQSCEERTIGWGQLSNEIIEDANTELDRLCEYVASLRADPAARGVIDPDAFEFEGRGELSEMVYAAQVNRKRMLREARRCIRSGEAIDVAAVRRLSRKLVRKINDLSDRLQKPCKG